MLVPISVELNLEKWPVSNFIMISLCFLIPMMILSGNPTDQELNRNVLDGWNIQGLVMYQFIHGGFFHLMFNMVYLWIFGNAICAKTGNRIYPVIFIFLGILAGMIHLVFDGRQAVGASGTINGLIGMYVMLYPLNKIRCFYFIFVRFGTIAVPGIWLILIRFAMDIYGASQGTGNVAYWAHIGGFAAGIFLAGLALGKQWIVMEKYDKQTLPDLMGRTCANSK